MKLSAIAATLAALVLVGCSDDPGATAETPACPVLTDDDANPDQIKGEPGCYTFTARGTAEAPLAALELPSGYTNFGHFALWPADVAGSDETGEDVPFRAIQYWTVHGVPVDPCDSTEAAPEIGPSVQDLADALAAHARSETTEPEPVTLDGHDGLYLELRIAPGLEPGTCSGGYYFEWEGSPGDAQHTVGAGGTVERLWIVDVDGVRVVLVAIGHPGTTRAQFDELNTIVESVEFVES